MKYRSLMKWSALWHKEFNMQQVKFFTKILLLSLMVVLPIWQTSALAADNKQSAAVQQVSSVNINTANADQLSEGLNGVGMKRALGIVEYRNANGVFTSPEQLLEVKGIGTKVLEKNKHRIVLK